MLIKTTTPVLIIVDKTDAVFFVVASNTAGVEVVSKMKIEDNID